jgi:hypothetical protein
MLILKLLTVTFGTVALWQMYLIWESGRQLRSEKNTLWKHRPKTILEHKYRVVWFGLSVFLALLLIELMGILSKNPYPFDSPLLIFHLGLDTVAVLLFCAILLRYRGTYIARVHRWLVYTLYTLCVAITVTGVIMLYELR